MDRNRSQLKDLGLTVEYVQRDRSAFPHIDDRELTERKQFITAARGTLGEVSPRAAFLLSYKNAHVSLSESHCCCCCSRRLALANAAFVSRSDPRESESTEQAAAHSARAIRGRSLELPYLASALRSVCGSDSVSLDPSAGLERAILRKLERVSFPGGGGARVERSLLGPDSVVSSSMRTIERVLKEPRDSDAYVCALDRPRCTPFHPHSQDETNSPRKERSRGPGSRRASWLFEDRCIGVKTQDRGLFVWAVVRAGAGCVLGRSCQVQDRSGRESRCRGPARCRKRRVAPNHSMCMSFSIWTLERSNVLADVSA